MDCKGCRKKEEKIKKLTDGIRQKIKAYTELSVDSPLPVSHLIASVLNVLNQAQPPEVKGEGEKDKEAGAKRREEKSHKGERHVKNLPIVHKSHSHRTSHPSSSSLSALASKISASTSSASPSSSSKKHGSDAGKTGGGGKTKRKSTTPSSCPTPVKIQTPDISSSSSSSRPHSLNKEKKIHPKRNSTSLSNFVETALKIPSVVRGIFKCLNYDDLQSVASVGPLIWKEQAESLLSRRTLLNITFDKANKISMVKTLGDEHTRCEYRNMSHVSSSLRGEEKGNEIWVAGSSIDLSSSVLSSFFKKSAPFITRLTLFYGALNKMSPSDFHGFLRNLSSLTYLVLATIPSEWKSLAPVKNRRLFSSSSSSSSTSSSPGDKNKNSLVLPRIKTIVFKISPEFYPEFIQSLLQIVPNVKYVFNFPVSCIKALDLDPGPDGDPQLQLRLDKIKSTCFSSTEGPRAAGEKFVRELSLLAHFSSGMALENMHLNFKMASQEKSLEMWIKCCESLSSILQDNNKSLRYLKIEPFPLPQYLEYPELPALEKLHLFSTLDWKRIEHEGKVCKFFPAEFNISETFPNLKKVKFEGKKCALGDFLHFFPADIFTNSRDSGSRSGFQNVSSLSLKFKNLEDVESLQKAASLFPGVKNFSMDGDVQWLETRLIHILDLWPRLKKLKLTVDVVMSSVRLPSIQMYPLDAVFTGIPEVKCAELRKTEKKRDIKIHEWQENVAISNMTELTELRLIFAGNLGKTQKIIPLFSHVTPLYGFQLLPKLNVIVGIQWDNKHNESIQKMLEPIQKYVDFQPNYY